MISGVWSLSTISDQICSFEVYYWGKSFPSGVTILLALCNLPKAVEAVTEATSKLLRVKDISLQDSERDLSV
jgi:hypothetical protein